MSFETWVSNPGGGSSSLDSSPFRRRAISFVLNGPGVGSIEYNLDNALVREQPNLFADGNLVWMRYRGKTGVWIVEERKVVLDENEHATDWVQVSGRGAFQLLGDRIALPPAFEEGANLDPSTWGLGKWTTKTDASAASGQPVVPVVSTTVGDGASVGIPIRITGGGKSQVGIIESIVAGDSVTLEDNLAFTFPKGSRVVGATEQWRRFVNRAAGEMLWDLIEETNPFIVARGGAAIVRGIVETTGADGWTQDFRFDDLLEIVDAVTSLYGDVEMDGLTFNYRNALGVDRSAAVIFEEGADLVRLERSVSDRDTVSWIVGEGVGEGVFAKLAIAEDATIGRPRMAYLDAKDAGNLPLLQLKTDAALAEHAPFETTSFEFKEERYQALVHFDVGDTIRAIAPSRNVDAEARIVALYLVEEDDDRIRVACDLTSPRPDQLLGLDKRQRSTASSLGVRNRQPQGQLVPIPFSGADVFDSTDTMDVFLKLTDRAYVMVEVTCTLRFRQFFATASSAASSGTLSSDETSLSLGFTAGEYIHNHSNPEGGNTGLSSGFSALTSIGPHQHTVAGHTHPLVFGVPKETYPVSHSVTLKVYEREDTSWILRGTFAGLTDDLEDLDLTAVVDGPGDWRFELKSDAAQPNGGRLGCDVYGLVWAAVKSA